MKGDFMGNPHHYRGIQSSRGAGDTHPAGWGNSPKEEGSASSCSDLKLGFSLELQLAKDFQIFIIDREGEREKRGGERKREDREKTGGKERTEREKERERERKGREETERREKEETERREREEGERKRERRQKTERRQERKRE
ncbi:hypothetical protein L345_08223, partial [Ophiophagus hannah]